ncbi:MULTISPECIES: Cupredoxin [unclassified Halomonas]|uniref:Cupredoxin n=1 Tax=unclassified Halomonas TaxID=2609666 RepID=UPI001CF1ABAF|nr:MULTISPECIES: Cupredoxin [unclassified Halomonas]MCA8864733.1 Cupredoxin [Halomonas sp. SBBP1]UZH11906.1 Cupredoxin [Halomonas sp. BDJS001]
MPQPTLQHRPFSGFITAYAAPLLALLVITLLVPNANAAQIAISSADGQPLEHAVVEVYYDSAAGNSPQEENIYQRDAAFHPKVLTVPTGSHVAFPNQDTTRHHVYSFSPAKTFDLNLYLKETPPAVHFDQPGIVVLGCNIHDHMQAFIVVSDAPYTATTGAEGVLILPTLPVGEHRVRVWHPRLDDSQQVWWEGIITDNDQLEVSLELNALPPPAPTLSPLQQRFRDAT